MKFKVLITATLLGLAAQAMSFETVSRAYEIALSNFIAPPTPSSAAMFRECDDCDQQSVRVTANTRYIINGRTVRFEQFKDALQEAGDRDSTPVTLLHRLETDTVVSISVSLR